MNPPRPSKLSEVWQRQCTSIFGAMLCALIAALVDGFWAKSQVGGAVSLRQLVLTDAGLIAPFALICGVVVGWVSTFLHGGRAPSAGRLALLLRDHDAERRAYFAALAPLSALGTAAFILVDAKATLRFFLLSESAQVIALGAGVTACVLAFVIGLFVLAAARGLAKVWHDPPDPLVSGVCGAIVGAAVVGFAVAAGETSGTGGPLALFGVLKRPELDLRAPALIAFVALGAYGLPAALRRAPAGLLLGVSLLPLALTLRCAGPLLNERKLAVAIERGAPLGKLALSGERKLTDRDRDGFSAFFGGGDCDDRDPHVNPGAEDLPGNARDEDCSGRDDIAVSLKASQPALVPEPSQQRPQPLPKDLGVVLITVDTLRHDLGYAGNPRPVSPNIDRLARRSVVFDNAYSLASYTSKSLPPLLIGKYASETHRGFTHFNRFGRQDTFIQERLQTAGVRTISVQGYWYFVTDGVGFERGFDVIDSSAVRKGAQVEGDRTTNSDKLSDAAIALLGKPENTSGRFFLWVHYLDPHAEYVSHDGFDFGSGNRDRYDSEVAFTDAHVGRLLDFIEKSPFAARTAIVLTSDHGEAFGEHGMIRHGFELWEELIRVPLILSVPGAAPARVSERRSAIDLVPTVLDLYGLPVPPGTGDDFISGTSLLPDLFAADAGRHVNKVVFVDMPAGPNNSDRQAFIEADHKLVTNDALPIGLYDLAADPGEKHDLLDDAPLKSEMLAHFKAFRRGLRRIDYKPTPK